MKNRNIKHMATKSTLKATLGPVCFATLLALGMVETANAAITADTSAANQPGIHTGASGATIVDINKASEQGVSHNIYSEFNVDKNGVVLNNGTTNSATQLAGDINANNNLAGKSATIILNEVRSSDPSQLNGMVEVAGKTAQVVIANPSGITCDGCGFINTSRATLTTGAATFDENGILNGVDVKGGQVVITGKGMDAGNANMPAYTDILARSVKLNAKLQANNLNIVTGANHISKQGAVTRIEGEGKAPALALDASTLGSMYAGKINMLGTEEGVGVRLDHADLTATNNLTLSVDGKLDNDGGNIQAGRNLNLVSVALNNEGANISSGQALNITTRNDLNNQNGNISGGNIILHTGAVNNQDGTIASQGSMSLSGTALNNVRGDIRSGGEMSVYYNYAQHDAPAVNAIDNNQGSIVSKGNLFVHSTTLNNDAGLIKTEGQISVNAGTLINTHSDQFNGDNGQQGGIYSGGVQQQPSYNSHTPYPVNTAYIHADNLNNDGGVIKSSGNGVGLAITGNNSMSNNGGVVDSAGDLSITYNRQISNNGGILTSNQNLALSGYNYVADSSAVVNSQDNVNLTFASGFDNAGLIKAGKDFAFSLGNSRQLVTMPFVNKGQMLADGKMTMNLNNVTFNNEGKVYGNKGVSLYAQNVKNQGEIVSNGDVYLEAKTLTNAQAALIKGNSVKVKAISVNNQGTITPDYIPVQPDNGGSSGNNSHTPISYDDHSSSSSHTPISHNDNSSYSPYSPYSSYTPVIVRR